MASWAADTCFTEDETIEGVIAQYEKDYNVKGEVAVPHGPAGGWPIVKWTGDEEALQQLAMDHYGQDVLDAAPIVLEAEPEAEPQP